MRAAEYQKLLDQYHAVIKTSTWSDGKRDDLVKQMDLLWAGMTKKEREQAQAYATMIYQQTIGGG